MPFPLGEQLRHAREARGLTLQQAGVATRIRAKYLAALEDGALDEFASMVQLRGFLRNYAVYLKLDPEELAGAFDTWLRLASAPQEEAPGEPALQLPAPGHPEAQSGAFAAEAYGDEPDSAARPSGQPVLRVPARAPAGAPARRAKTLRNLSSWLTGDIIAGAFIMGALLSGLMWGLWQLYMTPQVESSPTAVITATPRATAIATWGAASATPWQEALTPAASAPTSTGANAFEDVQVTLRITERAWLQVATDGQTVFQGMVPANTTQSYQASSMIALRTGNAGAVVVTYNGQALGPLGQRNAVVERIWGPAGPLEPTVTPLPTATDTPSATPAPTETSTPVPTPTATATSTSTATPTATSTPTPTPPPALTPRRKTG